MEETLLRGSVSSFQADFFPRRKKRSFAEAFFPGELPSSMEETLLRRSISSFQLDFFPQRKKRFFAKAFFVPSGLPSSTEETLLHGSVSSFQMDFFSSTEETLLRGSVSSFQMHFFPRRKKHFFAEAFLRSKCTFFLDGRNASSRKRFFVSGGLFSSTEEMLLRESVSSFQVDFLLRWKKRFFAEAFLPFPRVPATSSYSFILPSKFRLAVGTLAIVIPRRIIPESRIVFSLLSLSRMERHTARLP